MTGISDETDSSVLSPDEAFSVLGDGTRIQILQALGEAERPLSFTELRREVGYEDPGNFRYHLEQLRDHFVRRQEDRYTLQLAGEEVVRAVLTGSFTEEVSLAPETIDERCIYCGEPAVMAYEDGYLSARCSKCPGIIRRGFPEGTYMHYEFPPAGLYGRTREEAVDAAHVYYDSKIAPMMKGICPECAHRIDISHNVCTDHTEADEELCEQCEIRFAAWVDLQCPHCRYRRRFPLWMTALNHPAVVGFYADLGLEETIPFRKQTWDSIRYVENISDTVLDTDPYRFRVTISIEGEQLVVEMDADLNVEVIED